VTATHTAWADRTTTVAPDGVLSWAWPAAWSRRSPARSP
jgi:hypothetical protein